MKTQKRNNERRRGISVKVVICFLLFGIVFSSVFAQSKKTPYEEPKFMGKTRQQIVEERKKLISELIKVLKDEKSAPEERKTAAELLGELRAEEAVNVLINNLAWQTGVSGNMSQDYPSASALVKIASADSVSKLINLIRKFPKQAASDKKSMSELAVWVLAKMDPLCAKAHLEDALKKEKSDVIKKRLEEAMQSLEKFSKSTEK